MPELKTPYLRFRKRTICPGCQFWIPWYQGKKGETVYGCRLGMIPYKDNCSLKKLGKDA